MNNEPYLYFDEMAIHSFLYSRKAWSYMDEPVQCPVNSGTRLKVSVYGAIGNVQQLPFLDYYYKPTNGIDVLKFLQKLKQRMAKLTDKKVHIILDNHAAHRSNKHGTKPYFAENFITHFMPPSSPQINAIEHFWSPFKARFKKALLENPLDKIDQGKFE